MLLVRIEPWTRNQGKNGGSAGGVVKPVGVTYGLPTMLDSDGPDAVRDPPWSRVEGKSRVNLPQMPPLRGGVCMGAG